MANSSSRSLIRKSASGAFRIEALEQRQFLSVAPLASSVKESNPASIALASTALPQPVILSVGETTAPGPMLTTLTPTFTWKPVTGVTFDTYQINLYDITTAKLNSIQVSHADDSYTLPAGDLAHGDSYVWNLRLKVGDATGPESTTYLYFRAPAPVVVTLPAPVAVSPGSTISPGPVITGYTPTFTWKAVTGVSFTGYQINLYDVTTGKFVSYKTGASVTNFTLSSTESLSPANRYEWNVRALDGSKSGPPSAYFFFHTAKLPQPVILGVGSTAGPGPKTTTLTPTLTWKPVTGVNFDSYQINLYDITTGKLNSIQVSPSDDSYTLLAGDLTAGDSYVWNLRLKVGGTTGPESTTYLYFVAE